MIERARASAGIVHGETGRGHLGGVESHGPRQRVVQHTDAMRVVSGRPVINVVRAVVVVGPVGMGLVGTRDELLANDKPALSVARTHRHLGHTATIAVVGQLARTEGYVGRRDHDLFPRHAPHVPIATTALLVDNATEPHEAAVLRIYGPVADGGAKGGLVHVTFVDHDRQDQSRRYLIARG